MAILLNSTVGDPGANTYADLDYYKDYLAVRPSLSWTSAAISGNIDDELSMGLVMAARVLDLSVIWTGQATFSTQSLSWPRIGMYNRNGYAIPIDVNPSDLKDAQCELAVQLKESPDLFDENKALRLGIKKVDAGDVAVEFQSNSSSTSYLEYLSSISSSAMRYLKLPTIVRMMLVPSWYVEVTTEVNDTSNDFLFVVM